MTFLLRWQNILRSTLNGAAVLGGVALMTFLMFNVLPGDPARMAAGRHADATQLEMLKSNMGLDLPLHKQFMLFVNDLSPVSLVHAESHHEDWMKLASIPVGGTELVFKMPYLRRSFVSGRKVAEVILEGLPETLVLTTAALLLAVLIGIPVGIRAARQRNSWFDRTVTVIASAGMAIPSFVAAILIAWFFGFVLKGITGLNMTGSLFTYDIYAGEEVLTLENLILPAITLAIRPACVVSQLMKNSLVEVLGKDYIRTARAKGLTETIVVWQHALINAIGPIVSAVAAWFAAFMAGSVFVEYVFGWKGLGHVIVTAIDYYDFPVIMGLTLVVSVSFVFANWLLEVFYPFIDPSLRADR